MKQGPQTLIAEIGDWKLTVEDRDWIALEHGCPIVYGPHSNIWVASVPICHKCGTYPPSNIEAMFYIAKMVVR